MGLYLFSFFMCLIFLVDLGWLATQSTPLPAGSDPALLKLTLSPDEQERALISLQEVHQRKLHPYHPL